jgi:hypothetical protein
MLFKISDELVRHDAVQGFFEFLFADDRVLGGFKHAVLPHERRAAYFQVQIRTVGLINLLEQFVEIHQKSSDKQSEHVVDKIVM